MGKGQSHPIKKVAWTRHVLAEDKRNPQSMVRREMEISVTTFVSIEVMGSVAYSTNSHVLQLCDLYLI